MAFEPIMVGEASKLFESVYEADPVSTANQIRYFISKGLFKPSRTIRQGKHNVAQFDMRDLCKLRLLSHLVELGARPEYLRDASELMENVETPATKPNQLTEAGWNLLLSELSKGEGWVFVFYAQLTGQHAGGFYKSTYKMADNAKINEIIGALNIGKYVLNATEILQPLLNKIQSLESN